MTHDEMEVQSHKLTVERFITHPFSIEIDKSREYTHLYSSGYMMRRLTDGSEEYPGRNDQETKVLGYRFEQSQLISALNSPNSVSQAVVIDDFLSNIKGKLDRRALSASEWIDVDNYSSPHNELKEQWCEICLEGLELELVGIDNDFFRIGGNSMASVKVLAEIKSAFPCDADFALADSFKLRTIAKISDASRGDATLSFIETLTYEETI